MSPSTSSAALLLISSVLLLSTTTISAFNITHILEQYPNFDQFNSLLSRTHLAQEINRRKTITVLALGNDHLGEIAGKPEDVLKRILSTHVVLDYYDVLKLNKLKGNRTVMTTLYQATGIADDQQGFLVVAHNKDGIFFGSAMRGAAVDAKLEGSVATRPYDISVLSISRPIIATGIDGTWRPIGAPPPKAAATPKVPPPAESPEDDLPADAPTDDADAPAADADAPAADADAPAADADSTAPADASADAPGSDAASADSDNQTPPPSNAAGEQVASGVTIGLITALVSLWI